MMDLIFAVLCFVGGVTVGVMGTDRSVGPDAITIANKACSTNEGIHSFKVSGTGRTVTATCGNGVLVPIPQTS